jgi:WhiB family transcriptional regulator, redox-sensing transcriptional regulator
MTEFATEWRSAGACLSADPDLFFPIAATGPVEERQVAIARRICAVCSVKQQCLDFAMRSGEAHGIWGGTTPDERIRARRARTAQRRRLAARAQRTPSWPDPPQVRAS